MNYEQALKQVQAKKVKENYFLIEVSYDKKFILPHKAGVAFIEALSSAEQLKDPYKEPHSIIPLDRDAFTVRHFSQDEYEQYKIATLLGMSIDQVKEQRLTITGQV